MKIAVVTAVFGGVDAPKPFAAQSVECDRFYFTEANSPVPMPNLPDRLRAKYFKLQMHRVLPGYDAYVWIDGNIEVTSSDFVKVMTENLDGIRIQRHHERNTIKEEIEFILASENPYLTARYGAQPLRGEYEHYLSEGMPEDAALYSCNVFAYVGYVKIIKETISEWWQLCLEWSWFDQSAFSFIAWENSEFFLNHGFISEKERFINTINLGPMFNNQYFILHPHAKPLQ